MLNVQVLQYLAFWHEWLVDTHFILQYERFQSSNQLCNV